ncbi:bifunctional diaminohydroxyphosphoribosylaminopyrimidine deaminase/5-amino-6-(5-phosphoribosylamino)uracil reductase RibD [Pokkaliibacter sp. MBI-7]|uniref:bifunctional diaminohydroxyphosphoribosylaminopyrimidine deaminase/5-amino-6-(5-phosphoribosylamino)uracil reductase RibD n=1 Tax=Pokkaliibacter sp. MBI-7 TaxID=3040600 RepID=UPI00244AF79C|nr:bifunctional diaminohydroxyphosphoribosylaminopyrimidine deaminase/5-amino-6-(5-phosphoribosylamino)uracil reductase RibD [Pokkaliibacter sp. MBI-7]MDH2433852.1 bifunctional diaminohydroxyphosphoribosylaminopyrimidine deaminase/5-amino-6-(5-phosphoribosylamino)uracil reductase RibD [Pokkaliibacter sp. MBI-7]
MTSWSAADTAYMSRALHLAERGLYSTDPNPRVGCVLVKDGQVIGEGFHERAGEPHAEVYALRMAGEAAKGATAYVSLEPCAHHGRTPPCAEGLVRAGVARVVSAMQDPNPLVSGKGHGILASHGIEVSWGLLESQARTLNPGFIKRMSTGLPYVRVKLAMSLDGRTAMASGESQWITGAAARADVQRLRARSSAVVSGIDTVLADNAALTVRLAEAGLDAETCARRGERQPLRVVLDSHQRLAAHPDCRLLQSAGEVVLAHGSAQLAEELVTRVQSLSLPRSSTGLDLQTLLRQLAARGCNEVLVEAGATLAGAFVSAGLVDELVIYMAPVLLGSLARPLLNLPLQQMQEKLRLTIKDMCQVGEDWRITALPQVAD